MAAQLAAAVATAAELGAANERRGTALRAAAAQLLSLRAETMHGRAPEKLMGAQLQHVRTHPRRLRAPCARG